MLKFLVIKILLRKEVEMMAVIYVSLIVKGIKTYKDVPAVLKQKVKELLIALDLEELVTEE